MVIRGLHVHGHRDRLRGRPPLEHAHVEGFPFILISILAIYYVMCIIF